MALEKQAISVPLTGKIDTKTDPHYIPLGNAFEASNLYRDKSGRWTPRWGNVELVTTSNGRSITAGKRLAGRGKEICLLTQNTLQTWSADQAKWFDRGRTTGTGAAIDSPLTTWTSDLLEVYSASLVASVDIDLHTPDVAYGSGLFCFVWEDRSVAPSTLRYSIIEEATEQTLVSNKLAASNGPTRPKVVFSSEGYFLIFGVTENSGSASTLQVTRVAVSDLTAAAAVNVATNLKDVAVGFPWYDVQVRGDNNNVLVAWRSNGNECRTKEWDPTTNATSIAEVVTVASDPNLAIGWLTYNNANGNAYLGIARAAALEVHTVNGTTLAASATQTQEATPGAVANLTGFFDGTNIVAVWEVRNATRHLTKIRRSFNGTSRVLNETVGLASKAVQIDGLWYVMAAYDSVISSGYFLIEVPASDSATRGIVARYLRLEGGGLTGCDGMTSTESDRRQNAIAHVASVSSTKFVFALRKRTALVTLTTFPLTRNIKHGIVGGVLDTSTAPGAPKEFSESLFMPGACPRTYDGVFAYETGFHIDPEPPTLALAASGTGLSVGEYRYCVVFARRDAEGRLWRSAPSDVVKITTTGGNQHVTVTLYYLNITGRNATYGTGEGILEIYRTKVAGTAFYLHSTLTLNNWGGTTTNVTDSRSDVDLELGQELYTSGGIFDNHPPPPCLSATMLEERMVLIPAERRREVWASMPMVDGQGLYFNPRLSVRIDADGDNVAVAAMDGTVIVFKQGAIYALVGKWPNNLGQGELPQARRLSGTVGVKNADGLLVTSEGIFFHDKKGLYLLNRGLQVVYVGAPIETAVVGTLQFTTAGLTPVGAYIMTDKAQIRFFNHGGLELYYHLESQEWSVARILPTVTYVAATVVNGVRYYLNSSGVVAYEEGSVTSDAGNAITCGWSPGWLRFSAGVQRIYEFTIFGRVPAGGAFPGMTLNLHYDHANAVAETKSWASGTSEMDSDTQRFIVKKRPLRQKCQVIRPQLQWTTAGVVATEVQGVTIEAGIKRGVKGVKAAAYK